MIEKDEFLQRRRIKLAIDAELQCHSRHSIRFTRRVDPKSISFTLGDACHSVDKRGGDEKQYAENQCEQRKPCRIGNCADAPFVAPVPHGSFEENPSNRESDEDKDPKISYELRAMIEHVMSHLVSHDRADFWERALLEQVVIERN